MFLYHFIQVKPSSKLDPCFSTIEKVSNELTSTIIGEGNKLDEFIKKGNIDQAATYARSVLMSVDSASEQTDCGQALNHDTQTLVCTLICTAVTCLVMLLDPLLCVLSRCCHCTLFITVMLKLYEIYLHGMYI